MQPLPKLRLTAWVQASLFILTINLSVIAQKSATDTAIASYKNGDLPAAVAILEKVVKKNPEDADAWYYLGRSYYDLGHFDAAKNPFEQVMRLRPDLAEARAKLACILLLSDDTFRATLLAHEAKELGDDSAELHYVLAEAVLRTRANNSYEAALREAQNALRIDPRFSLALLTALSLNVQLGHDAEAAAYLRQIIAVSPDQEEAATWQEQLKVIEERMSSSEGQAKPLSAVTGVFTGKDVTGKARMIYKPEPTYSEPARRAGVQGNVIIRCIFSANGEIRNLRIIQALPFGLTTRALIAARSIRFEPATKDGHPVSMYIQLEYNFNLF